MKKIILLSVVIFSAFCVSAQDKRAFSLGVGVTLGLPVGTAGDEASFGAGAKVQAEAGLSENITGIATVGYNRFFYKKAFKDLSGLSGYNYIPIQVGARIYPADKFFIGAQIGYGIVSVGGTSTGGFSYNPHIGLNTNNFQLTLGYDAVSVSGGSIGSIGLAGVFKF